MKGWNDVSKKMPPTYSKFNESEYVLGYDDYGSMVVCWHNRLSGEWFGAHHTNSSIPIKICYWRILPKPPLEQ